MKMKPIYAAAIVYPYFAAQIALGQQLPVEIKFATLLQQSQCSIAQKKNFVIRSQVEWQKLWQQMAVAPFLPRTTRADSLLNKIDFNQQMIIAVFQGQKPTGGYSIVINKLVRESNRITAFVEEKSPGANCFTTQVLTQPYHVIVTAKSALDVVFTSRPSSVICK